MEQARLILAIALSFFVLLVWNMFFVEKKPVAPVPKNEEKIQEAGPLSEEKPAAPALPMTPTLPTGGLPSTTPTLPPRTITIDSPLFTVKISERGAAVTSFVLKDYRESSMENSPNKELISKHLPSGTLLSGFAGNDAVIPPDAVFTAKIDSDTLSLAAKQTLSFQHSSPAGILIEKKFTFSPDSYLIGLDIILHNGTEKPVQGEVSVILSQKAAAEASKYFFEGPSLLINNSVDQIKLKKKEDIHQFTGKVGWICMESRYFIETLIPAKSEGSRVKILTTPQGVIENTYSETLEALPPQSGAHIRFEMYFGPKSLRILKTFTNGLDRAVHFGMFDIIAKPCLWLMNWLYGFIPNYGIAIIILTTIIKILLWPLGQKSYKSMNAMKKLQPLMAEIREKYKDDKKKMNEELMGLYRIYKVNPMGGCLPMILQIPVFFALYRMLYEAIELRHAPFFGWITDLSAPDRLFTFPFSIPFMDPPYGIPVLTIVMGVTMFLQQKMSPPPGDPTQAKMMMFMPILFTVIFINFSAGLVLYWLVNNVLSIAQQYYTQKSA